MLNLYQRYITTNSDILRKVMRKQIGDYLVTLM